MNLPFLIFSKAGVANYHPRDESTPTASAYFCKWSFIRKAQYKLSTTAFTLQQHVRWILRKMSYGSYCLEYLLSSSFWENLRTIIQKEGLKMDGWFSSWVFHRAAGYGSDVSESSRVDCGANTYVTDRKCAVSRLEGSHFSNSNSIREVLILPLSHIKIVCNFIWRNYSTVNF